MGYRFHRRSHSIVCLGLARFAYGMLLPAMRAGLGLNYEQIGFISTGNFAGYLIAVIAAPALIRCFQPRITIVGGLLLIALCMLGISRLGHLPIQAVENSRHKAPPKVQVLAPELASE